MIVAMGFTKSTKNTHRYDSIDPDAAVTNIYIDKTALPDEPPKTINVEINF